jgi:4-amino-4-deoxy-L-arabinose transferase-like glycosyltransferase
LDLTNEFLVVWARICRSLPWSDPLYAGQELEVEMDGLRQLLEQNKWAAGICLLIAVITALVWVWGFNTHYFNRRDAYDYAQLSRQFYQGKGLSTLQIFPRHIPYFQERSLLVSQDWPNLYRNPLITITSAFFLKFFESEIVAMVIQSGLWYLAGIPVIFFLAKGLANLQVAILSTVFYVADPVIFLYGYSGMTETLATFLLLLIFAVGFLGEMKAWKWVLLGILSGLAYLARTQFVILIPLVFVFAWIRTAKPQRTRVTSLVLTGLLLPMLPWFVRNLRVAGDPTFSFTTTRNIILDAIPGHSDLEMQLHAPVDLITVLGQYGRQIGAKVLGNVSTNVLSPRYWANSFRRMYIIFPLFAILSLFRGRKPVSERYNQFKWSVVLLILGTFLLISLTVYSVRSYVMFRPLILILGTNEILLILDRLVSSSTLRSLGMAALVLLGAWQFSSDVIAHRSSAPVQSTFDQKTYRFLKQNTKANEVIATDISEQISLFTERRTLRLPADPAELLEINRDYLPIDYVLLSRDLLARNPGGDEESGYHETYEDYLNFVDSPEFLGVYQMDEKLPNGAMLFKKMGIASP